MLHVSKLDECTLKEVSFNTIKTNKKIEFLNIESAFDIETSSVIIQNQKSAFMYIWAFGIGYDNEVFYGRTWDELISLCELLQKTYNLNENRRLVIYVHNLSYEFQFMAKYFKWLNVFAVDERKPIKALCSYGIEFRDSYILSGFSLAKTSENLTTYKVSKMVGDLDYELVRTYKTPLNDTEMKYVENDIRVVNAYIKEQIEQYDDVTKIPMTNTGRVRKYVRDNCYYTSSNHRKSSKSKYTKYRKIMSDLTIDERIYKQLKRSFMGGFTHANALYVGQTLENVASVDYTSSYPSVMLSEQYPMSRGKIVIVKNIRQLEFYCKKYCLVFEAKFKNIRSSIEHENYLSESKCYNLVEPVTNNGRIVEAKEIAITLTNVDYDIIKQCYEWDEIEVANVTRFHKGYLPKPIIESIVKLYEDKTVLKDVEGKEVEYLLSKGMLNSVYGMSVTDIVQDESMYDTSDGWFSKPPNLDEQIEKYNNSHSRFLYYAWGIFVTAYARRNLWTGIIAIGDDYVYSDTDSIKLLNYDTHKPYIEWFDKQINEKLKTMCDYYKIDFNKLAPKNQKGVVKPIGVWDYEGTYDKFKTLGAKRYLYEVNGKFSLTVAGLSKQKGMEYMKEQCHGDSEKIFSMFNNQLYIPSNSTGKMTHTYIDNQMDFMINDYQGVECEIHVKSGIHLEKCEFTLSLTQKYIEFLNQLNKGYIYKGVKHI